MPMAFDRVEQSYRDQLSAYLDGELGDAERRSLEAHLATCADCRRELAELRTTVALLRRLPEAAPPRSLRVAVPAPRPAPAILRWYPRLRAATGLVAVFLLAVVVGDVFNNVFLTTRGTAVPMAARQEQPLTTAAADAAVRALEEAPKAATPGGGFQRVPPGGALPPAAATAVAAAPAQPPVAAAPAATSAPVPAAAALAPTPAPPAAPAPAAAGAPAAPTATAVSPAAPSLTGAPTPTATEALAGRAPLPAEPFPTPVPLDPPRQTAGPDLVRLLEIGAAVLLVLLGAATLLLARLRRPTL
jgi:hypothetical protein